MNNSIKSPLRYPGGKSKVVKYLLPYFPSNINDFKEPFIGGGSVFITLKSTFGNKIKHYWINDLSIDLYTFWKYVKDDITNLVSSINNLKQNYQSGRDLYKYLNNDSFIDSELNRAVKFFVMNRITFSGIMDSGGYSQQAFEKKFTNSSIERLKNISPYLDKVLITGGDYEELLVKNGKKYFYF